MEFGECKVREEISTATGVPLFSLFLFRLSLFLASSHRVHGVERVARGFDEGGVDSLEDLFWFFVGEKTTKVC